MPNNLPGTSKTKRNTQGDKSSVWDTIKRFGGYVSMGIAIFSAGYITGQYISDLKNTENNIKNLSEFQKEREQMKEEKDKLKEELNLYKFSNPNYATKEELKELKLNLEKFVKRNKMRKDE
jgi:hypothetical protein